jgi:hypothetical protein
MEDGKRGKVNAPLSFIFKTGRALYKISEVYAPLPAVKGE